MIAFSLASMVNGALLNNNNSQESMYEILKDINNRDSQLRLYLIDGTEVDATQVLELNKEFVIINRIRTRWI